MFSLNACTRLAAVFLGASAFVGCMGGPDPVSITDIDSAGVAAKAMELYDKDGDSRLSEQEVQACPPLLATMQNFDADGDGAISSTELQDRAAAMGSGLLSVICKVTWKGRPLEGATVKFVPAEPFKEYLATAEGITDETGATALSVPKDILPEGSTMSGVMQPGLYRVEIAHSGANLPEKYNTQSELGWEVTRASRAGISPEFDLK